MLVSFFAQCSELPDDYNIQIPNQFLDAQTVCHPGFNDCSTTPAGSPGAASTDFLMFISASHVASRRSGGTAAYATTCQRDEFDRPTVGRANFCPDSVDPGQTDQVVGIAVHELLHALGECMSEHAALVSVMSCKWMSVGSHLRLAYGQRQVTLPAAAWA